MTQIDKLSCAESCLAVVTTFRLEDATVDGEFYSNTRKVMPFASAKAEAVTRRRRRPWFERMELPPANALRI